LYPHKMGNGGVRAAAGEKFVEATVLTEDALWEVEAVDVPGPITLEKREYRYAPIWMCSCHPLWFCAFMLLLTSAAVFFIYELIFMDYKEPQMIANDAKDADLTVEPTGPVSFDSGPYSVNNHFTLVHVGNSLADQKNYKCVSAPPNIHCDENAEAMGTGEYPDKFRIMHNGDKICAYRLDSEGPWGLDLVLKCSINNNHHLLSDSPLGFTEIIIGDTLGEKTNKKCVHDPGSVTCDNNVEQVGRNGKWPDKFNIYHEGDKICAERVDSEASWGLNLVLKCKNK